MRIDVKVATLLLVATTAACAAGQGMSDAELRSSLTGIQEVPGPGDSDGSGTAVVRARPADAQVCWTLNVRGIDPATAAHIHRGPAGTAGPPVVPLATPDSAGRSEGCASVEQDVALDIAYRPFDYYVNVHTAAFPAGAVRGQLRGEVGRLRR